MNALWFFFTFFRTKMVTSGLQPRHHETIPSLPGFLHNDAWAKENPPQPSPLRSKPSKSMEPPKKIAALGSSFYLIRDEFISLILNHGNLLHSCPRVSPWWQSSRLTRRHRGLTSSFQDLEVSRWSVQHKCILSKISYLPKFVAKINIPEKNLSHVHPKKWKKKTSFIFIYLFCCSKIKWMPF